MTFEETVFLVPKLRLGNAYERLKEKGDWLLFEVLWLNIGRQEDVEAFSGHIAYA